MTHFRLPADEGDNSPFVDPATAQPPEVDILRLQDEVSRLSALLNSVYENRTAPVTPAPKVRLPEKFKGERSTFRGFIHQLELVFALRSAEYSADSVKIATFGTLLEGKALSWFLPFLEKDSTKVATYLSFEKSAEGGYFN